MDYSKLEIKVLTEDPYKRGILEKYWAAASESKWQYPSMDLQKEYGMNSHEMARIVREGSQVKYSYSCENCKGVHKSYSTRSDVNKDVEKIFSFKGINNVVDDFKLSPDKHCLPCLEAELNSYQFNVLNSIADNFSRVDLSFIKAYSPSDLSRLKFNQYDDGIVEIIDKASYDRWQGGILTHLAQLRLAYFDFPLKRGPGYGPVCTLPEVANFLLHYNNEAVEHFNKMYIPQGTTDANIFIQNIFSNEKRKNLFLSLKNKYNYVYTQFPYSAFVDEAKMEDLLSNEYFKKLFLTLRVFALICNEDGLPLAVIDVVWEKDEKSNFKVALLEKIGLPYHILKKDSLWISSDVESEIEKLLLH